MSLNQVSISPYCVGPDLGKGDNAARNAMAAPPTSGIEGKNNAQSALRFYFYLHKLPTDCM